MTGDDGDIDSVVEAANKAKAAIVEFNKFHNSAPHGPIPECGWLDYAGRIRAGYDEDIRGKSDESEWRQWANNITAAHCAMIVAKVNFDRIREKFLKDVIGAEYVYFTDRWIDHI